MIRKRRWWLLLALVPLLPLIYLPLRAQEEPPAGPSPATEAAEPAPAVQVTEPAEDSSPTEPLSADNSLSFPVDI